jgi:hypothetical protein
VVVEAACVGSGVSRFAINDESGRTCTSDANVDPIRLPFRFARRLFNREGSHLMVRHLCASLPTAAA